MRVCVKRQITFDEQWIIRTDTFFIANFYGDTGAGISRRSSFPGFIQVVHANQLIFPDYVGNNISQTLGNLTVHPRAGLLFVDFQQGHTLQLTGTAEMIWEDERLEQIPGAQRLIEFTIEQVLATHNAIPFAMAVWRVFIGYSCGNLNKDSFCANPISDEE
jgi:hypothetical protein